MRVVKNKRLELWAHLVSRHAMGITFNIPLKDLQEMHHDEHLGPGTIRDHDESSREFSLSKLGSVLSELDED